jgi:hypothetical protein
LELAEMFSYNFGHGLTLDVGAAVLFTGDFYRASPNAPSPDNLSRASRGSNWNSENLPKPIANILRG